MCSLILFCAQEIPDENEQVGSETDQEHGEEEVRTVDVCVEPEDQEQEQGGDDQDDEEMEGQDEENQEDEENEEDEENQEDQENDDKGEEHHHDDDGDEQTEHVDKLEETPDKDKTGTYKARTWELCDHIFLSRSIPMIQHDSTIKC